MIHLNDEQRMAVNHRGRNLLIIAGPGSGKTHTMVHRAKSFLDEGIPSESILLITFTRKAAGEIRERLESYFPGALKNAWIGTFHSICYRILLEYGHLLGLKPGWMVIDALDSERVLKSILADEGIRDQYVVDDIIRCISFSRNSLRPIQDLITSPRFPNALTVGAERIEAIARRYLRRCRRSQRVDFDMLQTLVLQLLREYPEVRARYQQQFKVILVDEYQDTNVIQAEILKLLRSPGNTITVVGDDAQAIYGFRAATVENILRFENDFQADRLMLTRNYRSSSAIVRVANAVIRNNPRQIPKTLQAVHPDGRRPELYIGSTPADEGRFIADTIANLLADGVPPSEIAVLFRAYRQSFLISAALKQKGIDFVVYGAEDFFALEHIKMILDGARLVINADDWIALTNLQTLLGLPHRNVRALEQKSEARQMSLWETLEKERSTSTALDAFYQKLEELKRYLDPKEGGAASDLVLAVIEWLRKPLKSRFHNTWEAIERDLEALVSLAQAYSSPHDFVNTVAMELTNPLQPETDENKVVLSTVHRAKGLEWDTVFVVGLVEFWFPLKWSIEQTGSDEEERRLFYVAITRAKKRLYLTTYARHADTYGTWRKDDLSRFVTEIPSDLIRSLTDTSAQTVEAEGVWEEWWW